jgi:uncharacterized protein YfbU (UPF0304 family)
LVAKGERFEMRLDEHTLIRIDEWRAKQEGLPSRAEAVRRLVDAGLASADKSVSFSDGERFLIMMMRDLYRHLGVEVDDGMDIDFISDAILRGESWALRWQMPGLFPDQENQIQDAREVATILTMWDVIEHSVQALPKKERDRLAKGHGPLKFDGFDGNHETRQFGIAQFLVERMGRFKNFKERYMNSHSARLGRYRRMLAVYEPLMRDVGGRELGCEQLEQILKVPYVKPRSENE